MSFKAVAPISASKFKHEIDSKNVLNSIEIQPYAIATKKQPQIFIALFSRFYSVIKLILWVGI